MKPLKLINPDRDVTRQQIEIAHIHQTWREWIGINGRSWQPVENPQKNPALVTDEVLNRTLYTINPQKKIPVWRKFWRWVSSWR